MKQSPVALLRSLVPAVVSSALFIPSAALGQNNQVPVISIRPSPQNQSLFFEGNGPETRLMRFEVYLSRPNGMTEERFRSYIRNNPVSFEVSTIQGNGGFEVDVATVGVDFVEFRNFPMTISTPPTATASPTTSTFFTVTIVGDADVEDSPEAFIVRLTNIVGARPAGGGTSVEEVGFIYDDDLPPPVRVDDFSTFEPFGSPPSTSPRFFNVTLLYPFPQPVTVNYATRNGTATGGTSSLPWIHDFVTANGSIQIPANTTTGQIEVRLFKDSKIKEPDQHFTLTATTQGRRSGLGPLPGEKPSARCTIRDNTVTFRGTVPQAGEFQFGPDNKRLLSADEQAFDLVWEVPDGKVWRDLRSVDVRVRDGKRPALWLRWDEASNQVSLVEPVASQSAKGKAPDVPSTGTTVGVAAALGTETVLSTPVGKLHLARCTLQGSGPTGKTATLKLAMSFDGLKSSRLLQIDLAATADSGEEDAFQRASRVFIKPNKQQ